MFIQGAKKVDCFFIEFFEYNKLFGQTQGLSFTNLNEFIV